MSLVVKSQSNVSVWGPTLVNAGAFALAFAAWVAMGPSAAAVCRDLGLDPALAAQLKSLPVLIGSVMRIPVGLLADRFGARLLFPLVLLVGAAGALALGSASSLAGIIAGGATLGFVGTSFTVGVLSVSSRAPAAKQGTALGLFSAGNAGSAITAFLVPVLLGTIGWRHTYQVYAVLLAATAVGYLVYFRRDAGTAKRVPLRVLLAPLAKWPVHRLGLAYMATFGGFVATCLMAAQLLVESYGVKPVTAGLLATAFAVCEGGMRYAGGWIADRFGARRVLLLSVLGVAAAFAPLAFVPPLAVTATLLVVAGAAMGTGCASVLRLVHERFPGNVGAVSGAVGAIGGVAGYMLPVLAGATAASTGTHRLAFVPIVLLALATFFLERRASERRVAEAIAPSLTATA
jgi:MFS transporter, NNP family, nitrate/nitrite transporter